MYRDLKVRGLEPRLLGRCPVTYLCLCLGFAFAFAFASAGFLRFCAYYYFTVPVSGGGLGGHAVARISIYLINY